MKRLIYLALFGLGIFIFFAVTVVNGEEVAPEPMADPVDSSVITTTVPIMTETPVVVAGADQFEPNNNFETAPLLLLGETSQLTLTLDDRDYLKLYLKAGQIVRLTAAPTGNGDTSLTVFQSDGTQLAFNDDLSATDRSASIVFQAAAEDFYIVLVASPIPIQAITHYDFYSSLQMPTPTPSVPPTATLGPTSTPAPTGTPAPTSTPVPSPTPLNSIDAGEPNNSPVEAYQIVPNIDYEMTLGPTGWDDHDFYSFLGKAWTNYSCETETAEIDTTIRMYTGQIGAGELVAENDDAGGGRISSKATFRPQTDQWVFVVVESRAGVGSYRFACNTYTPVMAAPVTNSGSGAAAPEPAVAEEAAVTEEPAEAVLLSPIAIAVFNDRNADGVMNMGEAVNDVLVVVTALGGGWVVQEQTLNGVLLVTEDTSETSHLIVSVPYLYYSQIVEMKKVNGVINIAIEAPVLPVVLP